MFCPTCGKQVPDDSAFCPGCGSDLSAARQVTQQMPPAAQQPTSAAPPFPQQSPQSVPTPGYPPQQKSHVGLIVGLVAAGIVVLLLFSLAGVFALRAYMSPGPAASPASSMAGSGGAVSAPPASPAPTTTPEAAASTPSATPAEPPAAPVTPAFGKADAIDVVGRFLNDLKSGKGKVAKTLATSRFKTANPGWIFGPLSGFDFEVAGATKKGSVWIVTTKESWQSGDETGRYTVVVKNGKGYVDRRDGLN